MPFGLFLALAGCQAYILPSELNFPFGNNSVTGMITRKEAHMKHSKTGFFTITILFEGFFFSP